MMKVFMNGGYRNIDPNKDRPKSFKQLYGFLAAAGGRQCFCKFGGKVYMISRQGVWIEVVRCIPDLTFNEYLKLSLK